MYQLEESIYFYLLLVIPVLIIGFISLKSWKKTIQKKHISTHLFIYDHLGKMVQTIELPSSTSPSLNIQLNNIKSGVYYLKTNNNKLYKKIIILFDKLIQQ